MTVLPLVSCAFTVKLTAVPEVADVGAENANLVAAPGLSEMGPEVPEIAVLVSVAVMVWLPEVLKVVENVPMPLVRVEFAGSVAAESVLVKCTCRYNR